ncbi:MAG: ECF transporter S component [Clostridiales bacterium]|jgi:riboflavin transporter FmnP|nr:ECF transporter S component [Clostridiales bacterium]
MVYTRQTSAKKLVILGMLSALAFLVMMVGRIPVVLFLKYDPKDVIIVIGGFLFGPLSAFVISAAVSFVEMFTVSDTGWIGFVMNIVSTCSFACAASVLYKLNRTLKGAVFGLIIGCVLMTVIMLLWNYFLTPIYMGMPRAAIAELLIPAFLPFNLLKGGLNAAIAMLLYKPVTNGLRLSGLMPAHGGQTAGKINIGVILLSVFVILTCALFILVLQGRI